MKCKAIGQFLNAYLDGEVTPKDRTKIEAHLAVCPHCREQLQELTATRDRFRLVLKTVADKVEPSAQAWPELSRRLETKTNRLENVWQTVASRLTAGLTVLKQKPAIVVAMTAIAAISLSMIYLLGPHTPALSLEVTSPVNNASLNSNLVRVTGEVSDLRADVEVNGVEAVVNNKGGFVTVVELHEGPNVIETVASVDNAKASQTVAVEFTPPLAVFLDALETQQGVDYRITPIIITGWVSDASATVTVNGMAADIAEDGNFSAQVGLQIDGNSASVTATASLGGSEDSMVRTIKITPQTGEVSPPVPTVTVIPPITLPPPTTQTPGTPSSGIILVEAGQSVSHEFGLDASKTIREPSPVGCQIFRVSGNGSRDKLAVPVGLEVSMQPSTFTLYRNATYKPIIVVRTSPDLPSGDYWLLIETSYGDHTTRNWVRLSVV